MAAPVRATPHFPFARSESTMSRCLSLLAIAALLPSCIPVTEPLSDVNKAEPVEGLVGKWRAEKKDRDYYWLEIDRTEVKGNPVGLMRMTTRGMVTNPGNRGWLYSTQLGKHTYLASPTEYVPGRNSNYHPFSTPDFDREGEFAAWVKRDRRRYFLAHYTLDGDRFTLYDCIPENLEAVMKAGKIARTATDDAYGTPPGWLAKYLTENGPEKLFPPAYSTVYRRMKD
jgi:hypothetical protein